jgi:hypothetical protein
LDLPDSAGEIVVCGILVLQGQRVLNMIARFVQAKRQRGSDHGVKAKGDGWLLTVALMDAANLAATKSSGLSDPYVVFTCNGKTKTSSIKFHTLGPQWNGKAVVYFVCNIFYPLHYSLFVHCCQLLLAYFIFPSILLYFMYFVTLEFSITKCNI